MPLIKDSNTTRIDLPTEGEWVDVKSRFSRNDFIELQTRVVSSARIAQGGQILGGDGLPGIPAGMAIREAEYATLELAITKWSFDEPINRETLGQLDDDSFESIKVRLNELYRLDDRRGDDAKNSQSSGPISS